MILAVVFAAATALAAILLGLYAARRRLWVEAGVCAGGAIVLGVVAAVASVTVPPLWLLLWAWIVVIALVGVVAYTFVRAAA